jgi:plasmid stabilization system protein ParE
MTLSFHLSDKATDQISRASAWYALQSPASAVRFIRSIEASFAAIRTFPRGHAIIRGTLRQAPMQEFPYVIMYEVTRKRIVILRVVHGRRHPRHRLHGQ